MSRDAQGRKRRARPRRPRDPHEHYVEEPFVSELLFAARDFAPAVVDPCAGFGHIVASARRAGLPAYGSDLVKRTAGIAGGADFLSPAWRPPRRAPEGFGIVCNPPFGGRRPLIRDFAQAALERAELAALLVPVARLAFAGRWLAEMSLAEILFIHPRTSLWPGPIYAAKLGAGEPLRSGFDDVCWLVFRRGAKSRGVAWLTAT